MFAQSLNVVAGYMPGLVLDQHFTKYLLLGTPMFFRIIEDPKKLLLLWVISIYISTLELKPKNFKHRSP